MDDEGKGGCRRRKRELKKAKKKKMNLYFVAASCFRLIFSQFSFIYFPHEKDIDRQHNSKSEIALLNSIPFFCMLLFVCVCVCFCMPRKYSFLCIIIIIIILWPNYQISVIGRECHDRYNSK